MRTMRIKFQPMPWLTVFTLICLAILIKLGTWQYQRLHWKTDLIAEIDTAAHAAPLTSVNNANDLFVAESPLDFRRVSFDGAFVTPTTNNGHPYHLIMPDGKSLNWRLIQPFQTDEGSVFVATRIFPNAEKDSPPQAETGTKTLIGYARLVRPSSKYTPTSNPGSNSWYVFNGAPDQLDWTDTVAGQKIPTGYYIDQVLDHASADELPVRKPELRNNHLDYMLTWFSFALILTIIYFILHVRAGRLTFKD